MLSLNDQMVLIQCQISTKVWGIIYCCNKSYTFSSNVKASNLVFLKTSNTEFDEIIITFTYENGRVLKIEDKVNLTLLINK